MCYNYNSVFKNSEKTIAISNDHLIHDALLNSMFIEDAKIEEYVDCYVVNELLIQDVLTNFIDLDDTTLSLLFEKDTTIDAYLDKYVTELLLEEI